ncbi:nuclear antigen EBNA1 [plant metagenome]|uniref:Nuclear antigen EBNA1 n=1 Tax=plant metagenome TaxID=1297885 RepID=A0A484SCQ4_9ZZZZ
MTRSDRRASPLAHSRHLALGTALACAGILGGAAQAADIGHSRLVSAPGAPLQVLVPVRGMSAEEAASLKAAIAPLSAWSEVNLAPPVALKGLRVLVEPGRKADERQLRIVGAAAPSGQVVDLLLDVSTASGQRRVQVSLLVPSGATPAVSPAVVAPRPAASAPAAPAPRPAAGTLAVQRGDTLFAIARANPVEGAGVLQVLVALWQANPEAFIGNNMNLLRAGAALNLPDAATVRAVDPREASRIYQQQVEAFNRGRGAGQAGQGGDAASGKVGAADAPASVQAADGQDRVRLSAADAAADENASSGKAIDEAGGRVDTLQRNVDSLKQALGEGGGDAAGAQAGSDGDKARNGATGEAGGAAAGTGAGAASNGNGAGASASAPASGSAQAGGAEAAGAGAATAGAASAGAASGSPAPGATESGQAGSAGQAGNGAAGASAGAGANAGSSAGSSPSATGATPPAASGGKGAASSNGAASGGASSGLSAPSLPSPSAGGANSATPATPDAAQTAPRGNWWSENLLAIVTGVLALIAFIIAWAMRRAGARQDDDGYENEDDEAYDPDRHGVARAAFQEKLERIDLDLDDRRPPSDDRR